MVTAALLLLLAGDPVVLRTNRAFAACLAPRAADLSARVGRPVHIEVGDPSQPAGADVVVGDDGELTRLLEGGRLDQVRDLGRLPRVAGERRTLIATAGVVRGAPREAAARALVAQLGAVAGSCLHPVEKGTVGAGPFASAVADWWLPACTLAHNLHNDPSTVTGPPDSVKLGRDRYSGMFSLGQGGYVVVEFGVSVVDGAGPDVRVYQTTTGEEVTLYASPSSAGPWTLVGLREYCGHRITNTISYCDFDLAAAGLAEARYLKIEDGELYPCVAGTTATEGTDIDAVELLNVR